MSTILASTGIGGAISPAGSLTVPDESDRIFTLTPLLGYSIADLLVDGVSRLDELIIVDGVGTWTFEEIPPGSHTVAASFAALPESVAEQIIAVVVSQLAATAGRPSGMPTLERDRVMDLAAADLPAMLLEAYEERLPRAEEAGLDQDTDDNSEERSLVLHFGLYAQASEGRTATQATDVMAAWIIHQLCGLCVAGSPFHGLADLIRPGRRASQLAKGAAAYCMTALEVVITTSYLTDDLTRRG